MLDFHMMPMLRALRAHAQRFVMRSITTMMRHARARSMMLLAARRAAHAQRDAVPGARVDAFTTP